MTKLSKREKYLVIGALVFASVALFVYFYYFPLKNEIKDLERQSEEVSLELDEAKSLAIKIDNMKNQIEELKIEAAESMAILMESIDEAEVLDYISNTTNYGDSESKISDLIAISYEEASGYSSDDDSFDNLYYDKDILLSFDSNYDNLKDVLKAFEDGDKYTSLTTMNIKSVETNDLLDSEQDEDSDESSRTVNTGEYPLEIECSLRFYGETPLWDGSGEYTFMEDGNFEKTDLFK